MPTCFYYVFPIFFFLQQLCCPTQYNYSIVRYTMTAEVFSSPNVSSGWNRLRTRPKTLRTSRRLLTVWHCRRALFCDTLLLYRTLIGTFPAHCPLRNRASISINNMYNYYYCREPNSRVGRATYSLYTSLL